MIDVLRIAHLRIAPQEGNLEVGNCEGNRFKVILIKASFSGGSLTPTAGNLDFNKYFHLLPTLNSRYTDYISEDSINHVKFRDCLISILL